MTRIKLGHYAFNEGYAAALDYRGPAPDYSNPADQMQWLMGRRERLELEIYNSTPRPISEILGADEQVISTAA